MNLLETPYVLNANALQTSITPDEYVIAGGMLAAAALLYFVLPKVVKFFETRKEKQIKLEKRQALNDLVKMKEIQTEIDEEMKQAMIQSALREKEGT
jgi:hypothetical protein